MKYIIIDLFNNSIVGWFDDEEKARSVIYELRKSKYIKEHPNRPIWEYDSLKIDNGYNLLSYKLVA